MQMERSGGGIGVLVRVKGVKQSELGSKCDDEGESGVMEMAEGRGKGNAGEKKGDCEISGRMEDRRGKVI